MLRIYPVILDVIRSLGPSIAVIERRDSDLGRQLRRALASVALNVSEGQYSQGRNRRARYFNALGSAREVLSCLEVAEALGYLPIADESVRTKLDHARDALAAHALRAPPGSPTSLARPATCGPSEGEWVFDDRGNLQDSLAFRFNVPVPVPVTVPDGGGATGAGSGHVPPAEYEAGFGCGSDREHARGVMASPTTRDGCRGLKVGQSPIITKLQHTDGGCPVATIVIDLPAELKPLVKPMVEMAEAASRSVRAGQASGRSVDYARLEERFAAHAAAIEAACHQVALQALDIDEPQLMIGGKLHTRVLRSPGTFKTMAGPVAVEHSRYRPVWERNAPTVDVISARSGALGDGWLPATAAGMAHAVQKGPSREAASHASRIHRLPYSRSAFEDVAHLVGQRVVARRAEVEDELIKRLKVPDEARSISVSVDRVTVPMEEPRTRPAGRPPKGAAKRPIERAYRMAYVGTVSLHDDEGKAIHTLRYGRMPQGDVDSMMRALASDVIAMLEQRPDLKVAALADGAAEMWALLREHISELSVGVAVLYLLDFWHVTEKLAAASRVIHGEGGQHMARWKLLLLNRRDAVDDILSELERSGKEWLRVGESRPVHDAITYLRNNRELMRYTAAKRRRLPIGSGIAEATCKSLFQMRMKRPGARWKTATGSHIIHLRALALSDRWESGIQLTLADLRQPIRRLAA